MTAPMLTWNTMNRRWYRWVGLLLVLLDLSIAGSSNNQKEEPVCEASSSNQSPDGTCRSTSNQPLPVGTLKPSDLPPPRVFKNFVQNTTVTLPQIDAKFQIAQGQVQQINNVEASVHMNTDFYVVPQIMSRDSVQQVLDIMEAIPTSELDQDPDTVDGMPTYEFFVESPELDSPQSIKVKDSDPASAPQRQALRKQLQAILQPILRDRITPLVQQHYPEACFKDDPTRHCTPCYSLIRRYVPENRLSHATHHDGHALVTVVVSLSDYGTDYQGGLYVSTGFGQFQEYLALHQGDAVMHQSTLLHGVQVHPNQHDQQVNDDSSNLTTKRWSWILWYRDSTTCQDFSYEWFRDCADAENNPICQQLHATKVPLIPGLSQKEVASQIVHYNQLAAKGGAGMAAVKLARAYLGHLPSHLPQTVQGDDDEKANTLFQLAAENFQKAIQSHHPDGHYGMAHLWLQMALSMAMNDNNANKNNKNEQTMIHNYVTKAVMHLEAAAQLGHAYSQFNLGMVHTYGYATGKIDTGLAAEWFVASGLPEGYFLASQQAKATKNRVLYAKYGKKAHALGFNAPWRKQARDATGSGGAAGVDLNLPWPPAFDGRRPPPI